MHESEWYHERQQYQGGPDDAPAEPVTEEQVGWLEACRDALAAIVAAQEEPGTERTAAMLSSAEITLRELVAVREYAHPHIAAEETANPVDDASPPF